MFWLSPASFTLPRLLTVSFVRVNRHLVLGGHPRAQRQEIRKNFVRESRAVLPTASWGQIVLEISRHEFLTNVLRGRMTSLLFM